MKTIEVAALIVKGWSEFPDGKIEIGEGQEAAEWLTRETLDSVRWLPADEGLVGKISELLNSEI